jgi:hypothetical protein
VTQGRKEQKDIDATRLERYPSPEGPSKTGITGTTGAT